MVEFGNLLYFAFIVGAVGIIIGGYHLLKGKNKRTVWLILFALLVFNLALHFLKMFFAPYNQDINFLYKNIWFVNICAVSVVSYPFMFLSKSKTAKDFMFYLGQISGFLAFLIPTEALGKAITLDVMRFYICHFIILFVPLMMVLLKLHTLDYKRIWKMPIVMATFLMFIMVNQALQSELGFVDVRNGDFFNINYANPSLIWSPSDALAKLFTIFTPKFMQVVPVGANAGATKFWPFFYLLPGMIIYFTILPLLISLFWERKHITSDIKKLVTQLQFKFHL